MRSAGLIAVLALAVLGCERTPRFGDRLKQVDQGETLPPELVAVLPEPMRSGAWKVLAVYKATSEYPLVAGRELCSARALLLERDKEAPRQVAVAAYCDGEAIPARDGSSFVTITPAVEGRVPLRLELRFAVALGPRSEVLWLTERARVEEDLMLIQERAWAFRDGKVEQVMDYVTNDPTRDATLPPQRRKARMREAGTTYAAGFVAEQFPYPFVATSHVRGRPTTQRLEYTERGGYRGPPLIPGVSQPPVGSGGGSGQSAVDAGAPARLEDAGTGG